MNSRRHGIKALLVTALASALLAAPSPAEAAAPCPRTASTVVIFGDSMTVGAEPVFDSARPTWAIDAVWGRGVTWLPIQAKRWMALHDRAPRVAIIALGTNEQAGWTRANYVNAIRMFPISTRIVFVNTYKPGARLAGISDGRDYSRWMVEIAQSENSRSRLSHHRITVANWRRASQDDPSLIVDDGTHQSPAGVRVWARLVADAESRVSRMRTCRE